MKSLFVGWGAILLMLIAPFGKAAIPKDLLGDWQGVFHCADSEFHFTLGLSEQEGRLSGELNYRAVSGSRLGEAANTQLLGSAESFGNSLSIHVATSDINNRAWIRMAYDEQKQRLFGKFDIHGYQHCSYAIAERAGVNSLQKELAKIPRSQKKITKMKNANKCGRDIKKWLSQLAAVNASDIQSQKPVALYLIQDENFKPYFGKSVFSLSDSKASEIGYQLLFGCRDQISANPKYRSLQEALGNYVLENQAEVRVRLWLDSQASGSANRWMARIKKDIQQGRLVSPDDVGWLRNHLPAFQEIAIVSTAALGEELKSFQTSRALLVQTSQLEELMKQEPSWKNLVAISKVNPDRTIAPEVRREIVSSIRVHITKHWRPAVEDYVADQNTLEEVRDLLVPLSSLQDGWSLGQYLPKEAVDTINSMLHDRRLKLTADFVAREVENYRVAFPEPENHVASLARWGEIEQELKEKYQDLLREPPLQEFNKQRRAYYNDLLKKGQSALIAEIGMINSPEVLDPWLSRHFPWYFIDEDAKSLMVRLRLNRLAEIAPFYGADNREYFEAIYKGDVGRIKQFEREHLNSQINLTLLPGVIAVYLLEYEDRRTRACLRSDAIALDVTTSRPETVTRDGRGVLINQSLESTSRQRHRVNKDFESILPKINPVSSRPGGGFTGFVGGQVEMLHNSMRRVMDTYPCDSIQIKTLEKNFIKLFNQLH